MNPFLFSLICGVVFGSVDVLLMIPLDIPEKTIALLAAFLNRFAIGFIIPLIQVSLPMWLMGGITGFLLSLPDAIITKAFFPIITVGVLGGSIIGWISGKRTAG
ncbi:MAG: hypothetical protein GXO91_07860 [FCB group bacterium]|nr:hypothetical protein [FCB group bacterium]